MPARLRPDCHHALPGRGACAGQSRGCELRRDAVWKKRYPSTLTQRWGVRARNMQYVQEQVHDGAYSGANQPVHGKCEDKCYPAILPLYFCLLVCKTPLHLNTRPPHFLAHMSRTHNTHTLLIHASMLSGRGGLSFPHDIRRCAKGDHSPANISGPRHRYPATAKPQRR